MSVAQLDARGVIVPCGQCGKKNRVAFTHLADAVRCGHCKAPLPPVSAPVALEDEERFAAVVGPAPAVLVDFYADWCGPCKMMAPELERVAAATAGRVLVGKVDTEAVPSLAQQYQISALPSLVLFSRGREIDRLQGARSAREIQRFVDQARG